jgi:DNA-3-methyladenine glycosylase I
VPRDLSAPRLGVRSPERPPAHAAGIRAGRHLPGGRPGRDRQGGRRGRAPLIRCWESADPLYVAYHDEEWGRPVRDERGLYERLTLEGFQSGLSWLTILRKREGFRKAFRGFDPEQVARFREGDVERLLADASIVRHRGKIEAAIANARATLALREVGTPLQELFWEDAPRRRKAPRSPAEWDASTPGSAALARRLRAAGFRFVGPTTVQAALQACGVVNDHLAACWVRPAVERERASVLADPLR